MASLRAFGWRQPVVVDRDGVIVVGHTRWKAADKLGLTEVPAYVADLTPKQAKAYRLADNQTSVEAITTGNTKPAGTRSARGTEHIGPVTGRDPRSGTLRPRTARARPGTARRSQSSAWPGRSGTTARSVMRFAIRSWGQELRSSLLRYCAADAMGLEIDPPYCDLIVRRYERFTGRQAQRQESQTLARG